MTFNRMQSGDLQGTLDFLLEDAGTEKKDLVAAYVEFAEYHKEQSWAQAMVDNYKRTVYAKVFPDRNVATREGYQKFSEWKGELP
jgi:hypothetical protein